MVEQWNSDGGKVKVEQCWLNSETEMVEPWNSGNSGIVMVEK